MAFEKRSTLGGHYCGQFRFNRYIVNVGGTKAIGEIWRCPHGFETANYYGPGRTVVIDWKL